MKKLIDTIESNPLEQLLGENVTLWCECYIYAGKLVGVDNDFAVLEDAKIVYETGVLTESGFKDAQVLPSEWNVMREKIESFGVMG